MAGYRWTEVLKKVDMFMVSKSSYVVHDSMTALSLFDDTLFTLYNEIKNQKAA